MTILASLLALSLMAMAVSGFAARAQAAPSKYATQPFQGTAPATGVNAPPAGSQPLVPGAWDAKNYRIVLTPASCPQPPAKLADRLALASSPTMRKYYALPNPADFTNDPAQWQELMAHSVTHRCDHTVPVSNGQKTVNGNNNPNQQWSGFGNQCLSSRCYNYLAASFKFVVRNISQSHDGVKMTTWVGDGGANGNALAQDGIAQQSLSWTNYFTTFYESVGCGVDKTEQDDYPVNTGDSMYFYTNRYGTDYIYDYTQNFYDTEYWGCGSYDSAEFIQERPSGTRGWPIPNFSANPYTFHNAKWEDGAGSWVDLYSSGGDGGSSYEWILQGGSGDTLINLPSWPGSDSPDGDTWSSYYWNPS